MNKCYVIKLTECGREDIENILFDCGVFKTKELVTKQIKTLAIAYAEETDKTIFDESYNDNIKIVVRYECKYCQNYDENSGCESDECYEIIYEFTIVEYDFIEDM